jgi:hypothetical protein
MRMLPVPLLLAAAVVAAPDPVQACVGPQTLEALIRESDHVALVRVVARHVVHESTRVVEYEVVHAFQGDPPARFLLVDPPERRDDEPAQPAGSDWSVLFLRDEAFVGAPWSVWRELARLSADSPLLDTIHLEPVLDAQGQLGVVSAVLMEPPFLLELLDVEPPPPAWMPLDEYTTALERKIASAAPLPAAP